MAENKNLYELNKLRQDGQIDITTLDEENKEKVEKVAQGKSTIEKVEQFVSEGDIIAEAMQNQLYINMLEPCISVGINITERLKKYFSEKKVKPEDLEDEIQKQMINIRTSINRGFNALVFDDKGNIDLQKSLQKARNNRLPIPEFVENIAIDENRKINITEKENSNLSRLLTVDEKKVIIENNNFIRKALDELNNNEDIKKMKEKTTVKVEDGKGFVSNDEFNELDNVIYNKVFDIEELLQSIDPDKVTSELRNQHILKLYMSYSIFEDIDKISDPILKEYALSIKKNLEESFRSLTIGMNISKVKFSELQEELKISDEVAESLKKEHEDRQNAIEKSVERRLDNNEKTGYKRKLNDRYNKAVRSENVENIALQYNFIKLYSNRVSGADFPYDNLTLRNAYENNRKVWDYSEGKKIYDASNIKVYHDTLKRQTFEKIFEKLENGEKIPEEYLKVGDKVFPAELMLLNYYVSFARARANDFHEDQEFAVSVRKKIEKLFPGIVASYNSQNAKKEDYRYGLNVKEIYKLYREKFKEYVDFKKVSDLYNFADDCTSDTFKKILEDSVNKAQEENFVNINEIMESESFYKEARSRSEREERIELQNRLEYEIVKQANELLNEANNSEMPYYREKTAIDTMITIVRWSKIKIDGKNLPSLSDDGLISRANTYLANKFPDAFIKGSIDDEKLEKIYKEYAKRFIINPETFNIDSWIDEPGKNFVNSIKWKIKNEKISDNPKIKEEQKREAELKKNLKINQNKMSETTKLYEFVLLYKRTRGQDIDESVLNALNTLEDGMKNKIKNVSVNLLADSQKEDMTEEELEEYKADYLKIVETQNFDIELFEQKVKTARTELAKRESIDLYKRLKSDTNLDDKRRVMSLYLGSKRDWEDKDLGDSKKNTARARIKYMLSRVFPEIFDGKDIDEKKLLEKYNEIFAVQGVAKVDSIDKMYSIEENKLIGEFISEVNSDFAKDKGVTNSHLAQQIVDDSKARDELVTSKKRKNITFDIETAVNLIDDIQDSTKANIKGELTKEEKIQYVKDLITVVGMFHGREWLDDYRLTDVYANYKRLSIDALKVSIDALSKIFPNIKDANGELDIIALEEQYKIFVEENNIQLPDALYSSESIIAITARERKFYEEYKKTINPIRNDERSLLEKIQDARQKVDQCRDGYEEKKDDALYERMYGVLKKIGQSVGKFNIENVLLANINDLDKRREIRNRAEKSAEDVELKEAQIDAVFMYAGDKRLTQFLDRFNSEHIITSVDKVLMMQVAIGTLMKKDNILDNNLVDLANSTSQKAVELLKKIAPNALNENDELNLNTVVDEYNKCSAKYDKYQVKDIAGLESTSARSLFGALGKVVIDGRHKDTIDSKFLELITMAETKDKSILPKIASKEVEQVFSSKAVEIDTSAIDAEKEKGISEVVVEQKKDVAISEAEVAPVVEVKGEEILVEDTKTKVESVIDENIEPKVEQQVEPKKISAMVVEDIDVDEEGKDIHPVVPKKQNIFSKMFETVKEKVGEFINRFTNNSSNNSDTSTSGTTSSSSGGIVIEDDKKDQVVQDVNMFGQYVDLDVRGAKESADKSETETKVDKAVEEK